VNDAPTLAVPGAQTVAENANHVFSLAAGNAITVGDVDAASGLLQLSLSVVNGTLTLSGTTGLSFTTGTGTGDAAMVFTGTVADLNAALNGLVYRAALNYNGADGISLTIDDLGNTGAGGPLVANQSIAMTVTAVNNPPTLAVPGAQTVTEDTNLAFSAAGGNAITVGDVDAGASPVQLTLSVSSGTLTLSGTTGLTFTTGTGTGDATMTFSGTLANVNAALNGLVYRGALNFNGADSLSLLVSDLGNTGAGGPLTASQTVGLTVTAVNDAPTLAVPAAQTVAEDTALVFSAAGGNAITVGDVDAAASPVQLTLSVASGTLTLSGTTGLSFTTGTGTADATMTFSGTLANVNAALNGLVYRATLNFNGPDTLSLLVTDLGNTGAGGPLTASQTVGLSVTAVNDAPSLSVAATPLAATEAVPLLLSGTGITIADVDAGGGTISLRLDAAEGQLTLRAGGTGVTIAGNDTASVTVSGTLVQIQELLDGRHGGRVDFIDAVPSPSASTAVVLTLGDLGNAGAGGPLSATATVTIDLAAVNDPPSITLPPSFQAIEQTPLALHGAGISIADPDAGNSPVTLTLTVGEGVLSAAVGTTGVQASGSTSASLTLVGTLAQINALLAGAGGASLVFIDPSDAPAASTPLVLAIDDGGHSGAGGARTASAAATIAVTAVNDPPDSLALNGGGLLENSPAGTPVAQASASDPDSATAGLRYSLPNSAGNLFQIDPTTGWITVFANTLPSVATASSFTVTVRVTDPMGAWLERNFVITTSPFVVNQGTDAKVVTQVVITTTADAGRTGTTVVDTTTTESTSEAARARQFVPDSGMPSIRRSSTSFDVGHGAQRGTLLPTGGARASETQETAAAAGDFAEQHSERLLTTRSPELSSLLSGFNRSELRHGAVSRDDDVIWRGFSGTQRVQFAPVEAAVEIATGQTFQTSVISVQAGGLLVSVGTIFWVLRASGLLAAMVTSLPAWRAFDPLVLLAPDDDGKARSIEAMDTELADEERNVGELFTLQQGPATRGLQPGAA
jgi:hypothetical protein